ncbi:MAG: sodium:panthothenate symporter [Verrucomicrobiota bacterium]
MHWIDWLIVIIPVLFLLYIALYSRKYVRGVVDYLAAGRVAGRYVLTVGDMTAGLGIITLVAMTEQWYHVGFGVGFWQVIAIPVTVIISLTGYCTYRFRESKALSNGQFLEMRYSRSFRIFASSLRVLAELLTNCIGPAIAANFFIYFLGLPHTVMLFGMAIPTFTLLVGFVLVLALIVILPAGRISLLITDCIQGLFCYPVFVVIAIYIMMSFSWSEQIIPVLTDRAAGESFLNPFDVSKLRDFNLFAVIVAILGSIYNRSSFAGNDASTAGRTPHEQKMASILGIWRIGFATLMCMLIAMAILTVMNHSDFSPKAHEIRQDLSAKVVAEVAESDSALMETVNQDMGGIPVLTHQIGIDEPFSQGKDLDTVYMDVAKESMGGTPEGNLRFQKFRSLYNQMMMPMGLRRMLPMGLVGMFCLVAILLMLTTDDSRIFNASTAIIQDLVLPLKKKEMTPEQHVRYVKTCSVLVALFFFGGSLLFAQLDYINMYLVIMVSIWLGGAGPVMVFGLYSRFGNTVGAYCSIFFGSGMAIFGALMQRGWANVVYPFLERHGWVGGVGRFLEVVSGPFNPYVAWEMNPVKCPINSYEFYFLCMLFGTTAYVVGSLIAYRKPFNLERLLHRGKYNTDGVAEIKSKWTWKSTWGKLIGITPDYTRGDKIIAWALAIYSFGYQLGLCFFMVVVWNIIHPWPDAWWSNYYFIVYFVVTPIIGIITTVWFFFGGIRDIRQLFRDLAKRVDNPLDDGRVEGHVALSDVAVLGKNEDEKG